MRRSGGEAERRVHAAVPSLGTELDAALRPMAASQRICRDAPTFHLLQKRNGRTVARILSMRLNRDSPKSPVNPDSESGSQRSSQPLSRPLSRLAIRSTKSATRAETKVRHRSFCDRLQNSLLHCIDDRQQVTSLFLDLAGLIHGCCHLGAEQVTEFGAQPRYGRAQGVFGRMHLAGQLTVIAPFRLGGQKGLEGLE